jgi:hypothetical protein
MPPKGSDFVRLVRNKLLRGDVLDDTQAAW